MYGRNCSSLLLSSCFFSYFLWSEVVLSTLTISNAPYLSLTLTGSPQLIIQEALAGQDPTAASDTSSLLTCETNQSNVTLSVSLNEDLPQGMELLLTPLISPDKMPTGLTLFKEVALGKHPQLVFQGLTQASLDQIPVKLTFITKTQAGPLPHTSYWITYTLSEVTS